jgi:hypothetical protein
MKKRFLRLLLGLSLVALGMLSVARDASAEETTDTTALLGVVGFGALDIGLATADFAAGVHGDWRSRGYGGVETIVGGAQLAFCLAERESVPLTSGDRWPWEIGAMLGGVFIVHGLVTLLVNRSHTEAPAPPAPVTVAPVALSDVARASVPGVAVLGRF